LLKKYNLRQNSLLDALDNVEKRQNKECKRRPVDKLAVGLSNKDGEEGESDDLRIKRKMERQTC
jgi:hypothetical protein